MFFYVQFYVLCYDNTVLMLWLGLSTNTPWLGLGKDQVLISSTSHHKNRDISAHNKTPYHTVVSW